MESIRKPHLLISTTPRQLTRDTHYSVLAIVLPWLLNSILANAMLILDILHGPKWRHT